MNSVGGGDVTGLGFVVDASFTVSHTIAGEISHDSMILPCEGIQRVPRSLPEFNVDNHSTNGIRQNALSVRALSLSFNLLSLTVLGSLQYGSHLHFCNDDSQTAHSYAGIKPTSHIDKLRYFTLRH